MIVSNVSHEPEGSIMFHIWTKGLTVLCEKRFPKMILRSDWVNRVDPAVLCQDCHLKLAS